MGINRRDRLSSDRRQNRPDGPAEQRLASDLTARFRHGDNSVLEKEIEATCWILLPQHLLSFNERTSLQQFKSAHNF